MIGNKDLLYGTRPVSGYTNTTSTADTPTISELLELMKKHKRPDDDIDVLVLTYAEWAMLRKHIPPAEPADNRAFTIPPWTFAGIQVESYPTRAEVAFRTIELRAAGKRVGVVEEEKVS